jgi:hypothetical protein
MVMKKNTLVHHWRYEDGWQHIPAFLSKDGKETREFREEIVGWHCWVYPNDDHEFEAWMHKHCPTTDCTHRFNSGDPMYTVHIKDQHEMLVFKLMFP